MTTRNTSRYATRHTKHDALDDFLNSPIRPGLNTVGYEGRTIDALLEQAENSETLIVSFHPAVTNENVTRPYFVGTGIFGTLNAHKLYFSDPSLELSDDLKLAWFAGNREQLNMQNDITSIILNVTAKLGAKNVILVGTSGGGFASLYYSSRIPGSLAYVVNPQTDLMKYHKQHVANYAKHAWGMTFDKALKAIPQRTSTSVIEQYAQGPENSVLWLQSITDQHHIEQHMAPLLSSAGQSTDIRVLLGEGWGPGHHPAPKELQVEILEVAVQCDGNWNHIWERFPTFQRPERILERIAT